MKWKYQNFLDRQTWLDFVKGLLIFLVVLGHSIAGDRAKNYDIIGITHYFIYSIHMPMFMLISGYLSKKPVNIKKAVKNYLIPYIIFDCLYLVGLAVRGQEVSWNILFPTYVYWYILALFIMRIILSTSNNFLVALILFVLSFFSVTITEHTWTFLSLGRVFLLYPIFYLGYRIQPMTIDRLRKSKCGRWIVTGLCAVCIGMEMEFLKAGIVDITWATHDYSSNILDYFVKYIYVCVCNYYICSVKCYKSVK